jgi:cytochrome c-type biogenesis protein CcmH
MVKSNERRRKAWLLSLLLLSFFTITQSCIHLASAQDVTPGVPTDDEVNAIARQLYCPVCDNVPLDVCPTQACIEWRELIREKLAEGWSEKQIKQYFVERFGVRTLSSPPARGLNWLVYIVPLVIILIGFFIFFNFIRAWLLYKSSGEQVIFLKDSPRNNVDYTSRLEEELKKNY